MLTPDHNPALRGRRIVIRLKRRSRTIFRGDAGAGAHHASTKM